MNAYQEIDERLRQQDADDWPEPDMALVRTHRLPAPPLPLTLFGPFWSEWIAAAAESKGCRVDFVAMPLLAVTGAMVANACRASPWSGWVEPPIFWYGSVGLPSSGKSPGFDAVVDLVAQLERDLDADFDDRRRDDLAAREMIRARREIWEGEVKAAVKKGYPRLSRRRRSIPRHRPPVGGCSRPTRRRSSWPGSSPPTIAV